MLILVLFVLASLAYGAEEKGHNAIAAGFVFVAVGLFVYAKKQNWDFEE
jgi:hypothetical protein